MGNRFIYDDDEIEVDDDTDAGQLKNDLNASDDDVVTVTPPGGDPMMVDDDDSLDDMPEGSEVSVMPAEGNLYG